MIHLIVGRTASGKDTLASMLRDDHGMSVVKSRTTRPRRSDDDDSHVFVSKDEAAAEIPNSVAHTNINGFEYYTIANDVESKDCYVIDVVGIAKLAECMPHEALHIVYISAPEEARKAHFVEREQDADMAESLWRTRNESENAQFEEFEAALASDEPIKSLGLPMNVRRISIVPNDYNPEKLAEAARGIADYDRMHRKMLRLARLAIDNDVMPCDEDGNVIIYDAATRKPSFASPDVITDIITARPEDTQRIIEWALLETDLLDELPHLSR